MDALLDLLPGQLPPEWRDDDPFGNPPNSPLVIDVDGDGIELIALEDSRAMFDLNMDGFAEHTGWVAPDDALLAWDRNGNGIIEDKSELFGDRDGFADGFASLAELDSDGNGVIDANDAAWSELSLWFDRNGDGRSENEVTEANGQTIWRDLDGDGEQDAAELVSLTEAGLQSIDLGAALIDETNEGHLVTHRSNVTWQDGSQSLVEDVWFQNDTFFSRTTEEVAPDPATMMLPNLKGYGVVADLRIAMSLDPALQASVEDLVRLSVTAEPTAFLEAFETFLAEWTGIGEVDPLSRGLHIDARQLAVLEKLHGRGFEAAGATDPGPAQGAALAAMYEAAVGSMAAKFLVQTPVAALILGEIESLEAHAYGGLGQALQFSALVDRMFGDADAAIAWVSDTFAPGQADALLAALAVDLDEAGAARAAATTGTMGDDVVTWDPATGNARFDGDTYHSSGGDDRLEIAADAAQIALSRPAGREGRADLVLTDLATGASFVIAGQFGAGDLGVDSIVFADGTTLGRAEMAAMAVIRGGDGDDAIFGQGTAAETFDGGAGDDVIAGGNGADTYVWGAGGGNDLVADLTNVLGETDVLRLDGLNRADVTLARSGDDLVVTQSGTGEVLTVRDHFLGGISGIERIDFADGNSLTAAQILAELPVLRLGTDGNETLNGATGRDRFESGQGDDVMYGRQGSDEYIIRAGDGNDRIVDVGHAQDVDVVTFADINFADVTMSTEGPYGDLVIRVDGTGQTVTIDDQFWSSNGGYGVELLRFADGVELDRAAMALAAPRRGTDGNDYIYGSHKDDVIEAGLGDDQVNGQGGSDQFIWREGHGNDRIVDYGYAQNTDTLVLDGVMSSQATFTRSGSDLQIGIGEETITVALQFVGYGYGVEQIRFDDATLGLDHWMGL